jgi:tRNA nucleotidyltransferase/poly(A) polymerase
MNNQLSSFQKLHEVFAHHGFSLYVVGGTVRDFLLSLPLSDLDVVTDATPEEMKTFLGSYDCDYTFAKFGSVKLNFEGYLFDLTTLRKEKKYLDARHPAKIIFVKSLKEDFKRRDFTINAMYMDEHFHVFDYCNGMKDISSGIIKTIGRPCSRIKEDPLRIIRALRFAIDFDFTIEKHLNRAIKRHIKLLSKINQSKIKQDLLKIKSDNKERIEIIFKEYDIYHLLDMIK